MYNLRKVVGEPYITCKCWKLFVNSLQVRQLSMKLNNLLAHYAQFDDLLTAATEKLDVTEYSLDKYSTSGTIDIIATHISSIQVCTVPPKVPLSQVFLVDEMLQNILALHTLHCCLVQGMA